MKNNPTPTMSWQPIATAPKTGQYILACAQGDVTEYYNRWRFPRAVSWRKRRASQLGLTRNAFAASWECWRDTEGNEYAATHWMPIPEITT